MSFDTTTVGISANAVGRRVFSTSVAEEVGGEGGLTRAYVMGLFPALTHSIWNDLDMKCKNHRDMKSCTKHTGVSQNSLSASMELCAFYDLVTGYSHAPRLRVAILPAERGKGRVGSDESGFVGGGCVFFFVFFLSCAYGLIQSP